MVKTLIFIACGILSLGAAAVVFCCLRAGALYDQWLDAHPPGKIGKEDAEYGTESNTG